MQVIFRSDEFAVLEYILGLQVVVPSWTGVEHLWDCLFLPRPEGSADYVLRERQVDVYQYKTCPFFLAKENLLC